MAEQWISSPGDDILNTGKVGPVDNLILCFWQSHASVSRGSYVGNARGRPRAAVDLPVNVQVMSKLIQYTVSDMPSSCCCDIRRILPWLYTLFHICPGRQIARTQTGLAFIQGVGLCDPQRASNTDFYSGFSDYQAPVANLSTTIGECGRPIQAKLAEGHSASDILLFK